MGLADRIAGAIGGVGRLRIQVLPVTTMRAKTEGVYKFTAYALFVWDNVATKSDPWIYMGAESLPVERWYEILGHELAHFEQWRKTGTAHERGVRVRGRTIARLLTEA